MFPPAAAVVGNAAQADPVLVRAGVRPDSRCTTPSCCWRPPACFMSWFKTIGLSRAAKRTWARSAATYLACVLIAACTLVLYLYLPLRSAANPPLDWGNRNPGNSVPGTSRRMQYDFMFTQYPRSAGRFLGQLAVYGHAWWREFAPGVALFGAAGLCLLLRRRRAYGALLVSSALLAIASGLLLLAKTSAHPRVALGHARVRNTGLLCNRGGHRRRAGHAGAPGPVRATRRHCRYIVMVQPVPSICITNATTSPFLLDPRLRRQYSCLSGERRHLCLGVRPWQFQCAVPTDRLRHAPGRGEPA